MNHERNSSEHSHGMESSGSDQIPYGIPHYVHNQMMGPPIPSSVWPVQSPAQYTSQQPVHQHIQRQEHQLEQVLQGFWANQMQEVENTTDFNNQSLPLADIEKIMKYDEDVSMEPEAPIILARVCEMFIRELTLRAWNHTEENKRDTLQKNDIAAAIARTDIFDFLEDIARTEDTSENIDTIPITIPLIPTQGYPFYYMPQREVGQWLPGMFVCQPVHHGLFMQQQQQQYIAYQQIMQQPQRNYGQQQEQEASQEVDQDMEQETSEHS